LKDVDDELGRFFDVMPPSIQIHTGLEHLREVVLRLETRFRYAVEVRHPYRFQDLSYSFFASNDICLVWNQLTDFQTPPVVTTDFVYMRFIGDRSIQEKDFGRIQIDRIGEMQSGPTVLKISKMEV